MATEMTIYLCDTAELADEARNFLLQNGYTAGQITVESISGVFSYDATTYKGGKTFEPTVRNKILVVGKKS